MCTASSVKCIDGSQKLLREPQDCFRAYFVFLVSIVAKIEYAQGGSQQLKHEAMVGAVGAVVDK